MGRRETKRSFAELVKQVHEQVPPGQHGEGALSPSSCGELVSADGRGWLRSKADLHVRVVRRLVASADVMAVGWGGGFDIEEIPDAGRDAMWARLRTRFDGPGGRVTGPDWPAQPLYRADEFRDSSGQKMLYLEEQC